MVRLSWCIPLPQSPLGRVIFSKHASLLDMIQRHQEGDKLATNFSRSLQVRSNDLTPAFTMLENLVQEYLAAISCKNEFGVTFKSPSFFEHFIGARCYVSV